jgi:translation initiation factor 3 subunit C
LITSNITMPRFFRQAGDSDSESESDEELLTSGDEDQDPAKPAPTASKPLASRFLRKVGSSSSSSSSEGEDEDESDASETVAKKKPKHNFLVSDSEDEAGEDGTKRIPIRAIDKRIQQMEATGSAMDNALKINDWVAISAGPFNLTTASLWTTHSRAEFDKLTRMVQRQHNVAAPVPPFFIRTLCTLETSLTDTIAREREAKKKMNATNARALTAMKQKVKKAVKEYEIQIKLFHAVRSPDLLQTFSHLRSGSGKIRTRVRNFCRGTCDET